MLGHAKAAMTLDVYADLFDDDLEAVADRLEQLHHAADSRTSADFLRTAEIISLPSEQPARR
jgi:hypothetical protein